MAFVENNAVPVNACYLVKCGTCGKTTWKVRPPCDVSKLFPPVPRHLHLLHTFNHPLPEVEVYATFLPFVLLECPLFSFGSLDPSTAHHYLRTPFRWALLISPLLLPRAARGQFAFVRLPREGVVVRGKPVAHPHQISGCELA